MLHAFQNKCIYMYFCLIVQQAEPALEVTFNDNVKLRYYFLFYLLGINVSLRHVASYRNARGSGGEPMVGSGSIPDPTQETNLHSQYHLLAAIHLLSALCNKICLFFLCLVNTLYTLCYPVFT